MKTDAVTLRDVGEWEALKGGNTPGMIETTTMGFCKFFAAIPFVSHVATFEDLNEEKRKKKEEDHDDNAINIAVFLHNPPVLRRKPGAFWDPCGTGEWMIHADYDIYGLFGKNFLDNLGEYTGELPIIFNPSLHVIIFDELVVTDPAYRRLEWKNWKSRRWIAHVFKTLKLFDPASHAFKANSRWQEAVSSPKQYHWTLQGGALTPSLQRPQYVGTVEHRFSKEVHTTGHRVPVSPWKKFGLVSLRSARSQGFEVCGRCIGKTIQKPS